MDNSVYTVVCTIVERFFPFRGLAPDAPAPGRDAIEGMAASDAVVRVSAGAAGARVQALVLTPGGKYMTNSTQLRALIEGAAAPLAELIIVADDTFFTKKNMTDVIVGLRAGGGATLYSAARFCNFICDIPAHLSVVPHEILPPAAVAAILARERRKLSDLPRIYLSDPMVVWVGARVGQVLKITRDSQTAGVAISYRLVVTGVF